MIVKNLTQNTEWDAPGLNGSSDAVTINFFGAKKVVYYNDIIFVNGWFYLTEFENDIYIECHRINALEAIELLEKQRELVK